MATIFPALIPLVLFTQFKVPPTPEAVKLTVPCPQREPPTVVGALGDVLMLIVGKVAVALQPAGSVTVTVYVVELVKVAKGLLIVALFKLVDGDQLYVTLVGNGNAGIILTT